LTAGQQADFMVLDASHPTLAGLSPEKMLASHVFASSRTSAVAQVWSSGQAVVQQGRHALHESAMAGLVQARTQLLKG
jgi:formimidoylglutamate deiminase